MLPAVVEAEKRPRAEPKLFAEPGKAEPNATEIIFWSCMLCTAYVGRVKELKTWVSKVLQDEFAATELKEQWVPSSESWPRGLSNVSSIYEPLVYAHTKVAWTEGALDAIGLAIQAWRRATEADM